MPEVERILVLNPGSTSTKVAVAEDGKIIEQETFRHESQELRQLGGVVDQLPLRCRCITEWLGNTKQAFSAIVSLGGLFRPVQGGVYRVSQTMVNDARTAARGEHASNLGSLLAHNLASQYHTQAFVVDPVSVDEFEPLAYYSGHPGIRRRSLSHALNIHAAARRAADDLSLPLERSTFIIAHLGGGISIAPVRNGQIIDVNDASSDGPFSPERTGGLPLQPFISMFFSRNYSEAELRTLVMGNGGLVAYLGTNSVLEVEKRIRLGDTEAEKVLQAMAYQIAKEIGAMATVVYGNVDAIILTGGVSSSDMLTGWIVERVRSIANILRYPGEDEMQAMASAMFRVLKGIEQVKEYL